MLPSICRDLHIGLSFPPDGQVEACYFKQFDRWLWHVGIRGESGMSKLMIPSTLSPR